MTRHPACVPRPGLAYARHPRVHEQERSQQRNKDMALKRLRMKLALELRTEVSLGAEGDEEPYVVPPQLKAILPSAKQRLGPKHAEYVAARVSRARRRERPAGVASWRDTAAHACASAACALRPCAARSRPGAWRTLPPYMYCRSSLTRRHSDARGTRPQLP